MPDDVPAATPQQPTAAESLKKLRTRLSGFRAHWQGCRKDAARDKYDADVMEAFCRDLDQLDALAADGCRAAGAATPPATAPDYCRERDAAYERYMGKRPRDPDGRDEDVWVTARNAFRAGWDARGALAAGAGAATPALTAAALTVRDLLLLERVIGWVDNLELRGELQSLHKRLTAATDAAAAPSPAAPDFYRDWKPTDANVQAVADDPTAFSIMRALAREVMSLRKAAPPESRDTPPRHKDREKAWEAFKVERYGSTKEVGIVPGVRIAFDFAWDAAIAAGGAAGATTAAQE